jgi:hypothetical protein
MTIDLTKLTPEQLALLQTQGQRLLGFTIERAYSFLVDSRNEDPQKDADFHRADAVGKFKHFLRTERRWNSFVDAAWPHLKPFAEEVVDMAISVESVSNVVFSKTTKNTKTTEA